MLSRRPHLVESSGESSALHLSCSGSGSALQLKMSSGSGSGAIFSLR